MMITRTLCICFLMPCMARAQSTDSLPSPWSWHFQSTVIAQKHSGFRSPYKGNNSLADTVEPIATSLSATLFIGRRLWKGASLYVNPEITGGKGLSFTTGVAGALNGETYRVGHVEPQVYIARAYLEQQIPLDNSSYEQMEDDINQMSGYLPSHRITISVGKFSLSDFFDDNSYAKDPRTQFFNWSIWANGAWDYPANTRGYTYGLVAGWYKPGWAVRLSSVAVPRIANNSSLEYRFSRAFSETLELERNYSIRKKPGAIRLVLSRTASRAPSYEDGLKALSNGSSYIPAVIAGDTVNDQFGGRKFSVGLNLEQSLSPATGVFARIGWNDGQYASWAFTEIDRTVSVGMLIDGRSWKRPDDSWGIAVSINGLSKAHRQYLAAGGYGFIIGDGALNYGHEAIVETFYNTALNGFCHLSFDYQFVQHPAFNKDRGPVHVFALRVHISW
ncbi:MAG: carbohydrate porin [Chitinophagaceae bacterium]|nr:carbohydrate porin [Chitinophagaceae bacterium]